MNRKGPTGERKDGEHPHDANAANRNGNYVKRGTSEKIRGRPGLFCLKTRKCYAVEAGPGESARTTAFEVSALNCGTRGDR